jgi:hypothetical protein
MTRCLFIFVLATGLQAQNIMPPTNAESFTLFERPEEVHLPEGDYTNITWGWNASPSPGVAYYNFYMSPTFRPWQGILIGTTTNLYFTAPCTNSLGCPGVCAVGTNGLKSLICI